MKKIAIWIALIAILSSSWSNAGMVYAQDPEADNIYTFADLGYEEKMMVGPYDITRVFFSTPSTWKLMPGVKVNLNFVHTFGSLYADSLIPRGSGVAGTLLIFFNDTLIHTVVLRGQESYSVEMPVPFDALTSTSVDGRHQVRILLDASLNCEFEDLRTTVIISPDSSVELVYDAVPPKTDLTLFPSPMYQPNLLVEGSSVVVVPNTPAIVELEAAFNVSAGLGSVSNGEMALQLLREKDLNDAVRINNHLIYVGIASEFSTLRDLRLPIDIDEKGLALDSATPDDGVVQIALSPWSQSHVVLFVGGNNPEGLLKASRAMSTGSLITSGRRDLSIIASVNPVSLESVSSVEDVTLKDLGYEMNTMGAYGESYFSYEFYATSEQASSEGAYFDLLTSHSNLLNFDRTAITILLNNEIVGSAHYAEDSNQLVTSRIEFLPNALRRGKNLLEVYSDLAPFYSCYSPDLLGTWLTISEMSALHLPVSPVQFEIGKYLDLRDYPYRFLEDAKLGDIAFVLPENDIVSWENASQIAFYLGDRGTVSMANLSAAYADSVPEEVLREKNLLVFGRASALPFLEEINSILPAPFSVDADDVDQPSLLVNYRILPEVSVGYVQLLPSPWNTEKAIMIISGNSEGGLPLAGASLFEDTVIAQLTGNFALLYEDQVLTTDTRLGVSQEELEAQLPAEAVIEVAAASTPVAASSTELQVNTLPEWIVPAFGLSSAIIIALLIYAIRKERRIRIGDKGDAEELDG